MSFQSRVSIRDRVRSRYGHDASSIEDLDLPSSGSIPDALLQRVQELAEAAHIGDAAARDTLYLALEPRLRRVASILRPWPSTASIIGIWDRDDVRQEGYLVFVDLLSAWDGERPFIPYLFARFGFRLRDRILRGIGKLSVPRHMTVVAGTAAMDEVIDPNGAQPESAWIARETLFALVRLLARSLELEGEAGSAVAILSQRRNTRLEVSARDAA